MVINKGDDYILKLEVKDDKGNKINPKEKASFYVRVYTSNKSNYLQFTKNDIVTCDCGCCNARLYIDGLKLASLESGVIAYTYGWGTSNDNFGDGEYNRSQTKYTDDYYKNDGYTPSIPDTPSNPADNPYIYPAYVGVIQNKELSTLTMSLDYVKELMKAGKADIGKIQDDYVRWDANIDYSGDTQNIFILVPANFPSLFVMDTTTQQFTIGAFDITNNISMDYDGTEVIYTLYVYKQDLVRFSARIKFGFSENIEEYVKQHPNPTILDALNKEIARATSREDELDERIDNLIYVEGDTLYINTNSNG